MDHDKQLAKQIAAALNEKGRWASKQTVAFEDIGKLSEKVGSDPKLAPLFDEYASLFDSPEEAISFANENKDKIAAHIGSVIPNEEASVATEELQLAAGLEELVPDKTSRKIEVLIEIAGAFASLYAYIAPMFMERGQAAGDVFLSSILLGGLTFNLMLAHSGSKDDPEELPQKKKAPSKASLNATIIATALNRDGFWWRGAEEQEKRKEGDGMAGAYVDREEQRIHLPDRNPSLDDGIADDLFYKNTRDIAGLLQSLVPNEYGKMKNGEKLSFPVVFEYNERKNIVLDNPEKQDVYDKLDHIAEISNNDDVIRAVKRDIEPANRDDRWEAYIETFYFAPEFIDFLNRNAAKDGFWWRGAADEHPLPEERHGEFDKPYRGLLFSEKIPVVGERIQGVTPETNRKITTSPIVKIIKEKMWSKTGGIFIVETNNSTYSVRYRMPESEMFAEEFSTPEPQPKPEGVEGVDYW